MYYNSSDFPAIFVRVCTLRIKRYLIVPVGDGNGLPTVKSCSEGIFIRRGGNIIRCLLLALKTYELAIEEPTLVAPDKIWVGITDVFGTDTGSTLFVSLQYSMFDDI